ncbi:hypothetical protein [Cochlodiniinecator piscidefendens]|uniref:hypothetical protein n=1 Tax=Cochlodiniinecator piscidefendens TaxID=2715756 RepID=UPI00140B12F0|nr:hypothetical protein [Cochlodiniinecator piscidefendens]
MKPTFTTLLASILILAGCAGTEITQAPVQFSATQALNEKGITDFTARTYVREEGQRREVSGIPCRFSAPGFSASFTTPAVVMTPDMGGRTPSGSITCTYQGQEKLVVMRAINQTTAEIQANANAAGAGAGLIGVIVSGISASTQMSRRDANLDIYGYQNVAVQFEIE